MMQIYLLDWVSVSLKLFHIVVGIAWIGASFYFNWLENKLNRLSNRDEIAGHLWAVHGGGFYYLEKYKKYPENLQNHCTGLSGKLISLGYLEYCYCRSFITSMLVPIC